MKKALSVITVAAAVMLLGIACSDERAYLDSVEEAMALSSANFEKFSELFGQAWPLPSQLFNALQEAGAGTAFDATLAALEKLEPPERFEADHKLLVSSIREIVAVDKDIGQSVIDQDVTAFVLGNVALAQASTRAALALSTPVCGATNIFAEGTTNPLCQRLQPGQGGAYGQELYDLMSVLLVEFRPRVRFFTLDFAAEGNSDILARFKPDIVQVLEDADELVGSLEPPAEFQKDHERLLSYLAEELEAAWAIPEVPTNRPLAGAGPPEGREGPPPVGRAKEDFSKEFLSLGITYFSDMMCEPGPDGGPPPGAG